MINPSAIQVLLAKRLNLPATARKEQVCQAAFKKMVALGEMQEKIKAKLEQVGLPYKEIQVYGSQITVETYGEETANQWATVINRFATVKRVLKTTDDAAKNRGTVNMPTKVTIYRVYATI